MPEAQQGTQPMSEVEVVESSRPELARAAQSGPAAIPRSVAKARVAAHDVNVYYGDNHALKHVDIDIHKNEVVAFIGPSGRSEEHTSELQSLMRISYAVFCLQHKTPAIHPLPLCPTWTAGASSCYHARTPARSWLHTRQHRTAPLSSAT